MLKHMKTFKHNAELLLLCLPAIVYFFIFNYIPMTGVIIAFKDYKYADGIFGSKWVGLKYFQQFFKGDVSRITFNTVAYGVAFIMTGVILGVTTAVLLYEVRNRTLVKYYQTVMFIPYFMSWVVVGLIVYIFLDPMNGTFNHLLRSLGKDEVMWYSEVKLWPFIIVFVRNWKEIGLTSLMYYAAMMGIDTALYEAATIDGANKWAQFRYITLPELMALVSITTILAISGLFRGDFGLFYQVPMDVGALYPATDILDTYIYRGLRMGSLSMNTAVGLYQSLMGLILVLIANQVVKTINSDNSLF